MPTAREIIVRGSTTGQDTSVITQGQPLEVVLQSGQGPAGIPGRNPEFQFSATHLQYRLVGDTVWIDLLPVSEIEGPQGPQGPQGTAGQDGVDGQDGVPVSLRVENGFLQWRYVDESNAWTDLLDMETLKGDKGDTGDTGDVTELRVDSGFIQWKYTQDVSWNNLIEISELQGPQGPVGEGLNILGTLNDPADLPTPANTGDAYIIDGDMWIFDGNSWNNVGNVVGPEGDSIELRVDSGFIQWKYTQSSTWNNLIELSELQGPQGDPGINGTDGTDGTDGREVEIQTTATHIQWRYVGDVTWNDLIALSTLQGPQGPAGQDGIDGINGTNGQDGADGQDGREVEIQTTATHIQWRYEGEAWNDLIALSTLQGPQGPAGQDGADGQDGREIEVQNSGTHIQWRYVGDVTWINLVLLEDLKGDKGDPGSVIPMATPPLNPIEGQMWWNSSDLTLYIWYNDGDSSQWVVAASQGPIGPQGPTGAGVATGGVTGQLLFKKSNTNFDTEWRTHEFVNKRLDLDIRTDGFNIDSGQRSSKTYVVNSTSNRVITLGSAPVGWQGIIVRLGTGAVSFAPASGQTVESIVGNSPSISSRYGSATVLKLTSTLWIVIGDIT